MPRLTELERENIELRIEARVKDQTSSQFSTLVSFSIALFGTLITAIVIFFAMKTKEAAVAEAAKGFEEFRVAAEGSVRTIRTESEIAREQMEDMLLRATQNAKAIVDMRLESQAWAENIAQRVAAKQLLSATDQLTLDLRSTRAEQKTAAEFSPEDYFLLIAKHIEQKNWELVCELAGSMRLVTSSKAIQSAGYFYEGTALYQLDKPDDALALFTDAVAMFKESGDREVEIQVAKCRNNMIVALMASGRHQQVLDLLPEAFEGLASLDGAKARDLRRKLLINKGNALSRLGRNAEALVIYDEVVQSLLDDDGDLDRDRLAHAHYNKGCAHAQMGRVKEAVECLEKSRSISITPYTDDINADPDFNPIRSRATFRRFMEKHGL